MIPLVTGDSLAVGIAPYVAERVTDAKGGIGSAEGARRALRHGNRIVYISLGANDSPREPRFPQRVRNVLVGRDCVAWLMPPQRPVLRAMLRSEARKDSRLRLVSMSGIHLSDGIHPGPAGYKILAGRMTKACRFVDKVGT